MARPTAEQLKALILRLARGRPVDSVNSIGINQACAQEGFEAPTSAEIGAAKRELRALGGSQQEAARLGVDPAYVGGRPQQVRDPFQPTSFTPARAIEEYSFEWWFNYFWAEARGAGEAQAGGLGAADERTFWGVVARLFAPESLPRSDADAQAINAAGTGLKVRADYDRLGDGDRRAVLTTLLRLGFEEFPLAFMDEAASLFAHHVTVPMAVLSTGEVMTTQISMALGYRSDSRPWSAISTQGVKARSHVPKLVVDMHMDKPWHPFADEAVRNSVWWRKGVKDNCLHTVISIASTFNDALYFPRIDDGSIYPFKDKLLGNGSLLDKWTPEVNQSAKAKRMYLVRAVVNGRQTYMFASLTTILVFAFPPNFRAANTEKYQKNRGVANAFPERGVGEIPTEYILAYLDVLRVHHGKTGDDGQTCFIRSVTVIPPSDDALKAVLVTDSAVMAFKEYIRGHRASIGQPLAYPPDKKGYRVERVENDDAYGPAFRNQQGGEMLAGYFA